MPKSTAVGDRRSGQLRDEQDLDMGSCLSYGEDSSPSGGAKGGFG